MRRVRMAMVLGSVLGLVMLGTVATGTATAGVGCGSIITANTTLQSDVGPCPGDGLIIGADNITLNLNGHRVFGTAAQGAFAGIRLPRRTGVRVIGPGSVTRFDAGVVIGAGSRNLVSNLSVHHNISNQFVADQPGAGQLGDGIVMFSSSNNVIVDNVVSHNGPFSGIAIASFTDAQQGLAGPAPHGNLILGNRVATNDVPQLCSAAGTTVEYPDVPCTPRTPVFNQDIGIRVEGPVATRNTVRGNTVTDSGRDGISVLNTPNPANPPNADNVIVGNTTHHNGYTGSNFTGYFLDGNGIELRCFSSSVPSGCPVRNVLHSNQATDNTRSGIAVGFYAYSNTIAGNRAFGNQRWDGEDSNRNPPCDNNRWLNNALGTGNQPCVGASHTEPPGASGPVAAEAEATSPGGRVALAGR